MPGRRNAVISENRNRRKSKQKGMVISMKKTKLLIGALTKYLAGLLLVAALLFLPAGTWYYPGAWLFLALLFLPILILGTVLFFRAPALLEKRLNHREQERTQRGVVALSGLSFVIGFVVAGLDFRFGWLPLPRWISITAAVLMVIAYALYAEVMRENAYLSRTVEVQSGQKVVDTGLYGIVRHPMYAATVLLFLTIPLVLGSLLSFVIFLSYPTLIVLRIRNEEAVLEAGLDGYTEYKKRVRYRLIPFIW